MFTLAFSFSLLLVAAYQGSRARDWTTYLTALALILIAGLALNTPTALLTLRQLL